MVQKVTDILLVQSLKQSRKKAWELLFYRYKDMLYHALYSRVNDKERIPDLVQDTFLKLWSHREHLDAKKSIKNFLYTTAVNLALDDFRKNQRQRLYFQKEKEQSPSEEIDFKTLIQHCVQQMPEPLKTVYSLNRYGGFKYREMAEILDISIKTVESRMSKALVFLKEHLILHRELE